MEPTVHSPRRRTLASANWLDKPRGATGDAETSAGPFTRLRDGRNSLP